MTYRNIAKTLVVIILIFGFLYAPFYRVPEAEAQTVSALKKCLLQSAIVVLLKGAIYAVVSMIWTVPTTDTASVVDAIKEQFGDVFARCMARELLDSSINGMLSVIRLRGRDGGSSIIRNWRNFFTNAEYRGEAIFRAILANTPVCNWLKGDLYSQFGVTSQSKVSLSGINIRTGSLDPFTLRGKCPFPNNFNLAAFLVDPMGNGGWDAYARFKNPAANPFGMYLMSAEELERNRAAEVSADAAEQTGYGVTGQRGAVQRTGSTGNSGYKSLGLACGTDGDCSSKEDSTSKPWVWCASKQCTRPPVDAGQYCRDDNTCGGVTGACQGTCSLKPLAPPSPGATCEMTDPDGTCLRWGNSGPEAPCRLRGSNGQCVFFNNIRTPSSYLNSVLAATINQELGWITSVDEIYEIVAMWLGQRLTNRILDLGANESDTRYGSNPAPSVTIPPYPGYTPEPVSTPGWTATPLPSVSTSPGPTATPAPGACLLVSQGAQDSFCGQVNAAIDTFIAANPSMFNGDQIIGDPNTYVQGVAQILNQSGLTAQQDPGGGDELQVKQSSTFSDQYDILTSTNLVRRCPGAFRATCTPAAF